MKGSEDILEMLTEGVGGQASETEAGPKAGAPAAESAKAEGAAPEGTEQEAGKDKGTEGKEAEGKETGDAGSGLIELSDDEGPADGATEEEREQTVAAFRDIASALGKDEFKSKGEVLDAIVELRNQTESLRAQVESKEAVFANDEIRQMNEIAKNGGDYVGFRDSKAKIATYEDAKRSLEGASPKDILSSHLQYKGKSKQEIEDYLEKLEDWEIQDKADGIKSAAVKDLDAAISQERSQMDAATKAASDRKKAFQSGLNKAANDMRDIDGVAVRVHQKDAIKRALLSEGTKRYFPVDENGVADTATWMRNAAIIELFPKLVSEYKKIAKSEEKSEQFDKLHNIEQAREKSTAGSGVEAANPLSEFFNLS